jgi:hypothetical protein
VLIRGNAVDANSTIDGTSSTIFNNLTINKSSNNVLLENSATVSNTLILTSGNLDIQSSDLTISSGGTISGSSSSGYIKTSSTGVLVREVGASNVVFPVGNSSYTPVTLNNTGTADNFNVRVENAIYLDGTSGNAITTDVVNATWYIDETTANGSDVTATFQWNASDELTDFDRTQAFLSNYHTNQWNNGTASAASGSNPYTLTESSITSFSPFIVASDATALPVELLYFYGEKEGENVCLDWQTATELNNSDFEIEWSTDGINFEKIGEVAGNGTTTEIQFYDFLHKNPVNGFNYYRLKQVDFDGAFEYSEVITITMERLNDKIVNIFPNPVRNELNIVDGQGQATIYNMLGQPVQQFAVSRGQFTINTSELAKGQYILHIQRENGNIITKRFMK